jgi:hypothetical protein
MRGKDPSIDKNVIFPSNTKRGTKTKIIVHPSNRKCGIKTNCSATKKSYA